MAFASLNGNGSGGIGAGEGALDVDEALVAAAAEAQADVALGLDKGAIDKAIEFADDIEQCRIADNLLPSVTGVAPDVVPQFLLDAVNEGTGALGLQQGVTAAEGDGSLVIGDDLHQFIEGTVFPTLEVP